MIAFKDVVGSAVKVDPAHASATGSNVGVTETPSTLIVIVVVFAH